MQTAVEIVQRLDGVQSISLLKRLNQKLFGAVTYTEVQAHLPTGSSELNILQNLDGQTKRESLDSNTSVELARQVLIAFACDKALAPVLVQAWEEIKSDDSLFVETIITLGLIANLTLFMATTQLEFKVGNLAIKKETANEGLVTAVLNPLKVLVSKVKLAS
ncbi:hypothetical protein [Occallatibacter riparius]|uniref:Uncharacterized protein n=1 Tax=Occallatibacter riparius TaxID=1002689 RepID=A0A9J7BRP0_9BACT|nr:hypothetical protein [Occallatibacter riparius]UWZ85249.1 hypothetical protein MOP44_04735 [Occallatibacter riparius]